MEKMKLEKPELTFECDANDPEDVGSWSLMWGDLRLCLSSEHADADKLYLYLHNTDGDDDDTAIIYPDGRIELGSRGTQTSFKDIKGALLVRDAVRLLTSTQRI